MATIKLRDLPDDFTPDQFKQLDRESLDQVPYDRKKWVCQVKGCDHGTHVRDYGLAPWYWLDRGSKRSQQDPGRYWMDLSRYYWLCGKHNKLFKRLRIRFDENRITDKFLDYTKNKIESI